MSLGNNPQRVNRSEPEPEECRYCDRRTYNPKRVCPDCRHERGDRLVPDGGRAEYDRATHRRYDGDPDEHEYGDARVGYNVPKAVRHGGAYQPMEREELSGNGVSLKGHCAAFECPNCGHVQRFATNEFVTWGYCRGCSTRSVAFEFKWRLNR